MSASPVCLLGGYRVPCGNMPGVHRLCAPTRICVRPRTAPAPHATYPSWEPRRCRGSVRSHEAPADQRNRTMSLKYNFSGIDGAASAVQRPAGAFQALLDEGAAFASTGDTGATEAKPFLQYKFSPVFTTKIDWSEAGDQDAFNFTTTDTSAKGCTDRKSVV